MFNTIKNFLHRKEREKISKYLYLACKENNMELFNSVFENDKLDPDLNYFETGIIDTLEKHNNITTISCFVQACNKGNLKMVRKLVESGCNIYSFNSLGFNTACEIGHDNIIEYLIVDANFQVNEKLKTILFTYNTPSHNNYIFSLIEKRDNFNKLQTELSKKKTRSNTLKI